MNLLFLLHPIKAFQLSSLIQDHSLSKQKNLAACINTSFSFHSYLLVHLYNYFVIIMVIFKDVSPLVTCCFSFRPLDLKLFLKF